MSSFEEIYRENVQQVARWAGWCVGADAEDVVQEVFLTAHRLLPGFRGDAQVSTWLFRLTANAARHHRRKSQRRRWLHLGAHMFAAQEAPAPSPENQLASSQDIELVRKALESLPEKYRIVLILSRLEGRSGQEIAELTETKLATVWVRLHRAREALAVRFDKLQQRSFPRLASDTKQLGGPT